MKKVLSIILLCCAFVGVTFAMDKVDLNTATQEQLESVKGIGPKKALAIIEYREQNGNFKSVEDLDNVKGFSKAGIVKIQNELAVGSVE